MSTFKLPIPPGVNGLFPTVMTDKGPKRVKSKAYRAWIEEAGWMIPPTLRGKAYGHFRVSLVFDRHSPSRKIDIDGLVKAPLDLLKTMGVIKDDSLNEGTTLDWSSPWTAPVYPTNPMVTITIVPLEAA